MDNLGGNPDKPFLIDPVQEGSEHAEHIYRANSFSDPRRQIRLVTIKRGQVEDDIHCELAVHSLDSDLKYPALSYRWGDPTDTTQIFMDGKPFQVTRNLEALLRQIRASYEKTELRLWIDALCINQRDDIEKSYQVQMMDSIYRKASLAFIWLGKETDDSHRAMEFFSEFNDRVNKDALVRETMDVHVYGSERWKDTDTGKWILKILIEDRGRIWQAVLKLFDREYWKRCWVMQEIALANVIILSCGKNWHTFRRNDLDFAKVLKFLDKIGFQLSYAPNFMRRLAKEPAIMATVRDSTRMINNMPGQNFPLFHLLIFNANLLSWDPRDRVFSLLGLVRDPLLPGYVADYAKPVEQVYREIAQTFINRGTGSDWLSMMLSMPQFRQHCKNLPSWVHDFSRHGTFIQLLTSGLTRKIFTAAGSTNPKFFFDNSLDVMTIDGFCYDLISHVSGPTVITENPKARPKLLNGSIIPAEWADFVDFYISSNRQSLDPTTEHDTRAAMAILTRTVVADRNLIDTLRDSSPKVSGRASPAFYQSMRDSLNITSASAARDEDWLLRIPSFMTFLRHRQLIVTKRGHVALCTSDAKGGDLICILLGVRVPLILRKDDDHYIILGHCYVDGIMDGEAIPDMEAGKFKVESFNIH